jgi:hypothetical protein
MFKIEVEDGHGVWSDVRSAAGIILNFENEDDVRAKLAELYPVIVQMEKYGGRKRTRVVRVFRADEEWKDGTPPSYRRGMARGCMIDFRSPWGDRRSLESSLIVVPHQRSTLTVDRTSVVRDGHAHRGCPAYLLQRWARILIPWPFRCLSPLLPLSVIDAAHSRLHPAADGRRGRSQALPAAGLRSFNPDRDVRHRTDWICGRCHSDTNASSGSL